MTDRCPQCAYWKSQGAKFCMNCGKDVRSLKNSSEMSTLQVFVNLSIILVIITILINTVYSVANFNNIYADCKDLKFSVLIPFGLTDIQIGSITGPAVGVTLAALIAIEAGCLAFAIIRYISVFKDRKSEKANNSLERTGLCAASSALAVSLFIAVVYFISAAIFGHTADTSWMNAYSDYQLTFMLTRAGVREEIMYRVLWIGIPMLIVSAIMLKDRKCWHYLFGGFGMTKVAWIFLLVSSILFGLAHYDGWGWTKVIDAAIGGIIFAYLYIEYGLYASIIAHTANDVMSSMGFIGLYGLETVVMLGMLLIGLVTIIYWIINPNWKVVNLMKMPTLPGRIEGSLLDQWKRH